MIEWETILLYMVGLLGVLVLAALLVWGLFYLYSYKCDKEWDLVDDDDDADNQVNSASIRAYINNKRRAEAQQKARQQQEKSQSSGENKQAINKQTMLSSLHRLANESDVVVASALSSIPLRQLGGRDHEVVVDVGQQMYLNREELDQDEHQCIVCRSRKEIAWAQVSCYARTTIGVLVYKRQPDGGGLPKGSPVLSVREELRNDTVGVLASSLANPRSKSVSTVTIAPSPDSRIQEPTSGGGGGGAERSTRSVNSSQQSSKSVNFSNKSPPSGGEQSAKKSPIQASSLRKSPQRHLSKG